MMLAASTFCQCPGCPGGTGPAYGTSPEVLMLYKPEKIMFKDYKFWGRFVYVNLNVNNIFLLLE